MWLSNFMLPWPLIVVHGRRLKKLACRLDVTDLLLLTMMTRADSTVTKQTWHTHTHKHTHTAQGRGSSTLIHTPSISFSIVYLRSVNWKLKTGSYCQFSGDQNIYPSWLKSRTQYPHTHFIKQQTRSCNYNRPLKKFYRAANRWQKRLQHFVHA